ncbi:MAG: zf-HC2 domain-containing protein [Deltaproteobacteria bacterium]|nr:zf-HC2 domain-containing protein [Deltaproteobacteria bacterium]
MKCDDCQELFSLYLDGEIDQISRSEVDSHFKACPQCVEEWRVFKNTVNFLRDIPMEKVPPGFLAGIHEKLERPSLLARFKALFFGQGERKLVFSTAFAMLVIGFVTASLIQLFPFSRSGKENQTPLTVPSGQMAQNALTQEKPSLLLADNSDQQDYYPGVPPLSEYDKNEPSSFQQLAMVPRAKSEHPVPQVDFVSTGATGHATSPYLGAPLTSLAARNQPPSIKPDLLITIHSSSGGEQMALVQQIVKSPLWRAELYNHSTLLLSVPSGSFDQLLQICGQGNTSVSPDYAVNSRYVSLKRFLTVAIKLD